MQRLITSILFYIGNLIKANSGERFFKNVNAFLNKDKNSELDINKVLSHYDEIFNEPLNVNIDTVNEINTGIFDLKHENFTTIEVNSSELKFVLQDTNLSKVVGDDGLSSYMLLNINQAFVNSSILYFFQFIFKYGVIP